MLERDSVGDIRGTVGNLSIGDKITFPAARGGQDSFEVIDIDRRFPGISTLYLRGASYEGTISITLTDSFRISLGR